MRLMVVMGRTGPTEACSPATNERLPRPQSQTAVTAHMGCA